MPGRNVVNFFDGTVCLVAYTKPEPHGSEGYNGDWLRIYAVCGRSFVHHVEAMNRQTDDPVTCLACIAGG